VVVADAGSRDGTVAAVRGRADVTRVLALANTGFGRAANAGVRATSARFVLVANADVRVRPGALARLAASLAAAADVAAVGPQVRYPSGALQASARRHLDAPTVLGHAVLGRWWPENPWTRRYHARDLPSEVPRDVAWLSGCALLLRREAFESVGGFDPGYFLYVEDVDLGDRLRAAGWRLRYEPAAVVEHRVGASTSRARGRALWHHAASLDRYLARRLHGAARLLRPCSRWRWRCGRGSPSSPNVVGRAGAPPGSGWTHLSGRAAGEPGGVRWPHDPDRSVRPPVLHTDRARSCLDPAPAGSRSWWRPRGVTR
jgi:N-acetylglucosaminyl-diphospho-decaprenol L-rhamnosyltransferase